MRCRTVAHDSYFLLVTTNRECHGECCFRVSEINRNKLPQRFLALDARCENGFVNLCSSSARAARRNQVKMSLRWIHENLEAPTCDEECSDIDDSCSDDSYDTELSLSEKEERDEDVTTENGKVQGIARGGLRKKRETRRPAAAAARPTSTVTFHGNGGTPRNIERKSKSREYSPYVIWDPRQPAKNPIYNCRIIKLYCRTGYHLAITPSGRVEGLSENEDSHALLHATPVSFGVIRIQSIETRLYLAFNEKGRLYGEVRIIL
ncbi:uncharacterized protein LOC105196647 isoform X2 [Solenopsis invicta]|uniref:uncharacterized protein LOC105196647 isoform X2 n=1 Tax=Solenopsis invicta TaxID=13686 RepID=UPI00193CACF2|nr:uncharacterized protein LOC105196647 isoform X2 [Solenopsis invicta]